MLDKTAPASNSRENERLEERGKRVMRSTSHLPLHSPPTFSQNLPICDIINAHFSVKAVKKRGETVEENSLYTPLGKFETN